MPGRLVGNGHVAHPIITTTTITTGLTPPAIMGNGSPVRHLVVAGGGSSVTTHHPPPPAHHHHAHPRSPHHLSPTWNSPLTCSPVALPTSRLICSHLSPALVGVQSPTHSRRSPPGPGRKGTPPTQWSVWAAWPACLPGRSPPNLPVGPRFGMKQWSPTHHHHWNLGLNWDITTLTACLAHSPVRSIIGN